eukprot:gene16140-biopygen6739
MIRKALKGLSPDASRAFRIIRFGHGPGSEWRFGVFGTCLQDRPGTRFLGGPWPGAGALARGLVVPGRDPGVSRQQEGRGRARVQPGLRRGRAWDRATAEHGSSWRQQGPGPRQSQGSARAEAGQSVGQSHCRAWQQLAAARGHHGGCIPGVLAARKNEENDHVSSNSDLKSGVIPILLGYSTQFPSARLAPRAGPGPRQSQGSARAEAGQSVGQSHCRA